MNKQEKFIAVVIGLVLLGWLGWSVYSETQAAKARAIEAQKLAAQQALEAASKPQVKAEVAPKETEAPAKVVPLKNDKRRKLPEQFVTLTNNQVVLTLSTHGAVIKSAKLLEYAEKPGEISDANPAYTLDFSDAPALALSGVPGVEAFSDYSIVSNNSETVVFENRFVTRKITLKKDYQVEVEDSYSVPASNAVANSISLGAVEMGSSDNDLLSIDSFLAGPKPRVLHHSELEPLESYLVGGGAGGCSGKKNAAGLPEKMVVDIKGAQSWIALKSRFFVAALAKASDANNGFTATMVRDVAKQEYALKSVSVNAQYENLPAKRSFTFFFGPKKQTILWGLGMKDVMEFGMWRWVCYPMVWILNVFHSWIPSFGIGIILLTILVRIIFWPLTHKSTVSMRRMQEIQPKIKEIQARCKGNPQKLQQETWQVYRDNKVNPMSSCLPMLVQIPVFIALFTVLRAAVELRYAPFLWIMDLSEPENLFPGVFPFGGLNILPILMAATMALQSALTPSTGDKQQQRMMIVMMPIMMLVMFYSFPSALSLYWTVSQILSIVQMWWIKKKYSPAPATGGAIEPDSIEMPQTRQMRRHSR